MKQSGKGKLTMKSGKYICRVTYSYQGLTSLVVEEFNKMLADNIKRRERNGRTESEGL